MSKGEDTKQRILEQTAPLLNRLGYLSTPLSEIMEATGMQKGGIYNHFSSKEDLALQALDYAIEQVVQRFTRALKENKTATARLLGVISVLRVYATDHPFPGGCPLLNSAIEGDDAANPALREKAMQAMDRLRNMFVRIVAKGIAEGDFRPQTHPDTVATLFVASFQGAVMLSKLYKDAVHLERVMDHLTEYVNRELRI